jgi:hypothetical protein
VTNTSLKAYNHALLESRQLCTHPMHVGLAFTALQSMFIVMHQLLQLHISMQLSHVAATPHSCTARGVTLTEVQGVGSHLHHDSNTE